MGSGYGKAITTSDLSYVREYMHLPPLCHEASTDCRRVGSENHISLAQRSAVCCYLMVKLF